MLEKAVELIYRLGSVRNLKDIVVERFGVQDRRRYGVVPVVERGEEVIPL